MFEVICSITTLITPAICKGEHLTGTWIPLAWPHHWWFL